LAKNKKIIARSFGKKNYEEKNHNFGSFGKNHEEEYHSFEVSAKKKKTTAMEFLKKLGKRRP
jgi:hypothetical protein